MTSVPRRSDGSLWDNGPYELQSPAWRAALNKSDGKSGGKWDPSLNEKWATRFLNARHSADRNAAKRGGVNTSQIDGQAAFIDGITGFGTALLQSIGVRNDAGTPHPQVIPAAWGRQSSAGLDTSTLLMVGAVGLGVYMLAKS